MQDDFKKNISDSIFDFNRLILPKIRELNLFNGELVSIEEVTNINHKDLIKQFDVLAGIDIWQFVINIGIKGIANRIQWTDKSWNTFTIRFTIYGKDCKTEYNKRLDALLNKEWLYPYYTIQSYITERRTGKLLSIGIAKTEDIFELIKQNHFIKRTNPDDGNTFLVVKWTDLINLGYEIKTYKDGIKILCENELPQTITPSPIKEPLKPPQLQSAGNDKNFIQTVMAF